jgi:hypothetical protein
LIETLKPSQIAQVAVFAAPKNLRKNSYEIFSKFCKTNPIFCPFRPENEDFTKKQSQSNPIQSQFKANINPKTRINDDNKPNQTQNKPNINPKTRINNESKPNSNPIVRKVKNDTKHLFTENYE